MRRFKCLDVEMFAITKLGVLASYRSDLCGKRFKGVIHVNTDKQTWTRTQSISFSADLIEFPLHVNILLCLLFSPSFRFFFFSLHRCNNLPKSPVKWHLCQSCVTTQWSSSVVLCLCTFSEHRRSFFLFTYLCVRLTPWHCYRCHRETAL
jgi:hypothetical protein